MLRSAAVSHIKQQSQLEELSREAGSRVVSPEAVPGSLLHLAFLGLCSPSSVLRKSAYALLSALQSSFNLTASLQLCVPNNFYVPQSPWRLVSSVSNELSKQHPEYALEFITESVAAISRNSTPVSEKNLCLMLMRPWVASLAEMLEIRQVQKSLGDESESVWSAQIETGLGKRKWRTSVGEVLRVLTKLFDVSDIR
jgi:hypothetical protein